MSHTPCKILKQVEKRSFRVCRYKNGENNYCRLLPFRKSAQCICLFYLFIYLLDRINNEEIRKETEIEPIANKIIWCRQQWREHSLRIKESRYPKVILYYSSRGNRERGRPRKG